MTTRKVWTWALVAALALMAAPVGAQDMAPNTIWGEVPQGLSGNAALAVLVDAGGRVVATVPVAGGRFEFPNVAPGDYAVQLKDTAGTLLVTSRTATHAGGGVTRAHFNDDAAAAAAAPGGKGASTTAVVAASAVAVGVGTAILVHKHKEDEKDKDKDKDKPPKSPKK